MTHERVKKKNKQRASEMNLAAILLCIVFLFLVCHFPRILLNVHELFMLENMIVCGVGTSSSMTDSSHKSFSCFDQCIYSRLHPSGVVLLLHVFQPLVADRQRELQFPHLRLGGR